MAAVSLSNPLASPLSGAAAGLDPCRARLSELEARPGRSLRNAPLALAWAEGVFGAAQFDIFATLTFARQYVSPEAANIAWGDWVRWVRRKVGHRVEWARVSERTKAGALHYHALLGDCRGLRRLSALDYWRGRFGFGQVERYDSGLGVRFYLSKYVSKTAEGELDVVFSRRFARLLGRGALASA